MEWDQTNDVVCCLIYVFKVQIKDARAFHGLLVAYPGTCYVPNQ